MGSLQLMCTIEMQVLVPQRDRVWIPKDIAIESSSKVPNWNHLTL
jgi:hypothetical protein